MSTKTALGLWPTLQVPEHLCATRTCSQMDLTPFHSAGTTRINQCTRRLNALSPSMCYSVLCFTLLSLCHCGTSILNHFLFYMFTTKTFALQLHFGALLFYFDLP